MTNQDDSDKAGSAESSDPAAQTSPAHDAGEAATVKQLETAVQTMIQEHRQWFLILGVVWIFLGAAAVILPNVASLAVELIVGWLLLFGGIAALIHAFQCKGWKDVAFQAVSGLLYLAAGAILLLFPLQGVLSLTLLLGIFFVAEGIVRCIIAFRTRPEEGWGWILASGIATVLVGLIIWGGWPGTAAWAIGLLVGIQLIFSGWGMVAVANAAKDK